MINDARPLFEGAATAMVTPFKSGNVDFDSMGKLIDRQIQAGISALIVCGTTGEAPTLSFEEWKACIEFSVRRVNGRIPVIAGSGSNCTQKAVELSKAAEHVGADGLLVVTPYYNKASSEGLVKHYSAISGNVNIPIILYNVPSRTGVDIPLDVYCKLSIDEKIVAVKEASGSVFSAKKIISECGDRLQVYSGNDDIVCEMMNVGALGCISVASNIIPEVMVDMCQKNLSNETNSAQNIMNEWTDLIKALFCEVNPIPVKYAMQVMGLCDGELRLPLCQPCEEVAKRIKKTLKDHCLI